MTFTNNAGWPEEILGIVENSWTVEYASLTKKGVPITFPVTPYVGEDGRTLDAQTPLTVAAKAQRARNNPKVCLLYSEPLGSGLDKPPVVLVYGAATVRDADLQGNTDRYVRLSFARLPEIYSKWPSFFVKTLSWYLARIWIEVTPLRILWWKGGDLSKEQKTWQAPEDTQALPSDPPPTGKGLKRWDEPPTEWRSWAEKAVETMGKPVLTVVDSHGYPVPFRTQGASLASDGFHLRLFSTAPAPAKGKACLIFHHHDEKFAWQENVAFVGEVSGDVQSAFFKVDRRLTTTTFRGSQIKLMLFMLKMRRQLAPRLHPEARGRGGQAVPKINLPE